MFEGKIISGIWEDGTIELSGMPKEFILSARTLAVCEVTEHDTLKAKAELFDELIDYVSGNNMAISSDHYKSLVLSKLSEISHRAKELSK